MVLFKLYINNIGILLKRGFWVPLYFEYPHADNSNNAWNVNGNNRNVNINNANNAGTIGVRPATFFKTKNFRTNIFLWYIWLEM